METEKKQQDAEFAKLRHQLDEQKNLITNQRKLLNKLQVLNEVTQGCITQSSHDLATKNREKQTLSIQISDKEREQDKLKKRHNQLQNDIKNCIPYKMGENGQSMQRYHPDQVTVLPDQHKKFYVPESKYFNVNKYDVRSQMAIFSEDKNEINYDRIIEPKD